MISIRNSMNAKIGLREYCRFAKELIGPDITLLEIGSYAGDSAEIFAEYFKDVYCCDPWQNGYNNQDDASFQHPMSDVESAFDARTARFNNVYKLKMTSQELADCLQRGDRQINGILLPAKFTLVYIDADHTYEAVTEAVRSFMPYVRYISGHDYQRRFKGVQDAVQELAGDMKNVQLFGESSWIFKLPVCNDDI